MLNRLQARYEQILEDIDRRDHSYRITPEVERMGRHMTEEQWGELETMQAHAAHAGDKLYVNGKHIERLLG